MPGHIAEAGNVSWCTPQYIIDAVRNTFEGTIDLDPCGHPDSIVAAKTTFSLPHVDGLYSFWNDYQNIYCNPPYGRTYLHTPTLTAYSVKEFRELDAKIKSECTKSAISDWIFKAKLDVETCSTPKHTILLIPSAVSTKHWQDIIFEMHYEELASICFLDRRVKFLGAASSAPMDCAVVFMYNESSYLRNFKTNFSNIGYVI